MTLRTTPKRFLIAAATLVALLFSCHYQGAPHAVRSDYSFDISGVSQRTEYPCVQIANDQSRLRIVWGQMIGNTDTYDSKTLTVLTYSLPSKSYRVDHPNTVDTKSHEWRTFAPFIAFKNAPGLQRDRVAVPFPTWAVAGAGGLSLKPVVRIGRTGLAMTRFYDAAGHTRTLAWQMIVSDGEGPLYLDEGLLVDENREFALLMSPGSDHVYLYDLRGGGN